MSSLYFRLFPLISLKSSPRARFTLHASFVIHVLITFPRRPVCSLVILPLRVLSRPSLSIFNNQCAVKINPKANFPSKICRSRRISTIASYVLTKGSQKDRIKDEGEKERGGEGDRETEGERQRERERKRWEREIRRGRERGGERRRAREKHRQRDSRRGPLLIQLLRVIETHTKTESRRETDRQIKCYLTKQTHFFSPQGSCLQLFMYTAIHLRLWIFGLGSLYQIQVRFSCQKFITT